MSAVVATHHRAARRDHGEPHGAGVRRCSTAFRASCATRRASVGKQVDFVVEGKEIELDRSMLDEIGDSIVHLLRNAIDHGIETPDVRDARGQAGRRAASC